MTRFNKVSPTGGDLEGASYSNYYKTDDRFFDCRIEIIVTLFPKPININQLF